ncbi:MAG TPA: glycosyltransferase family 2 protein [bacterium]|nr:glycosyltransferase family 2 protein [bacterium]
MKISAVMPAYNEAETIEKTVRYCFRVLAEYAEDVEVVVTNDGSRDDTGRILERLTAEFPGLVVGHNSPNRGYGDAMTRAIEVSTGDIIVTIDSDGQFDIADIREMLPMLQDPCRIVTGYRRAKKDSFIKVVADRVMNRIIRIMFKVSFKDTNCALKIMNGPMIRSMILEARGFQLPTEIVLKADALGFTVTESPVNHYPREGGASSLAPFRTGWQMLTFLLYLRRKIRLYLKGVLRSL